MRDIEAKQPDELLFPDFDETLRSAMRRETELFPNSVLRENRSVLDLLTANYTFLNERLAKHYGIPNTEGSYFRRYTFLEVSVRGGLFRVRMLWLKAGTTYYYTVDEEEAGGESDKLQSPVKNFTAKAFTMTPYPH